MIIGVIGGDPCSAEVARVAQGVGAELARRKCILVCGGRGGVMEAACKGAREAGGLTIGILPGPDRAEGNRYLSVPIVTNEAAYSRWLPAPAWRKRRRRRSGHERRLPGCRGSTG
ncbi:MAG: hypothetical protein Q8O76_08860 [Chloroflexota bacterium]|nr:hypothetical protein [Chloroflexota bacterium]